MANSEKKALRKLISGQYSDQQFEHALTAFLAALPVQKPNVTEAREVLRDALYDENPIVRDIALGMCKDLAQLIAVMDANQPVIGK